MSRYVFVIVCCAVLAGCASSREATVTLPPAPSSVHVSAPDTLIGAPPERAVGRATLPEAVEVYRKFDDRLSADITGVEVSSESVVVRTPAGASRYRAPSYGETLTIEPDAPGELRGVVTGRPEPRQVEAEVPKERRETGGVVGFVLRLAFGSAWRLWVGAIVAIGITGILLRLPRR